MKFSFSAIVLSALSYLSIAHASLLVNYNGSTDDPSVLGILNLEAARGDAQSTNSATLYFKKGADWMGRGAGHAGRAVGDIRAEYHSLKSKTVSGTTYYIGYTFAMQEVPDALMVFQWKEYLANNANDGGANIPLSLEVKSGNLQFNFQPNGSTGRLTQWETPALSHTIYTFGIEILALASGGNVKLFLNGTQQTFSSTGTKSFGGNTFPGSSSPKFGAYRGEVDAINTWIYDVQVGTSTEGMNGKYWG